MSARRPESAPIPCERPELLQSLYRAELAAVRMYEVALAQLEAQRLRDTLHHIRLDHLSAAEAVAHQLELVGAPRPEDPGIVGQLAGILEQAATLFGPVVAIEALKKGELLNAQRYGHALKEGLSHSGEALITEVLLPGCKAHIEALNAL